MKTKKSCLDGVEALLPQMVAEGEGLHKLVLSLLELQQCGLDGLDLTKMPP